MVYSDHNPPHFHAEYAGQNFQVYLLCSRWHGSAAGCGLAGAPGRCFCSSTDVPTTHWAYPYVEKAAAEGVVTGVGNNRYNPSGTVTCAEFCTMLVWAFRPENLDDYES